MTSLHDSTAYLSPIEAAPGTMALAMPALDKAELLSQGRKHPAGCFRAVMYVAILGLAGGRLGAGLAGRGELFQDIAAGNV